MSQDFRKLGGQPTFDSHDIGCLWVLIVLIIIGLVLLAVFLGPAIVRALDSL
jgi:hypothetical protein